MFKEVGREETQNSRVQYPIAEVAGGAGREMTSEEVVKHLESEQRLANAAEDAIDQVMAATPQRRIADTIKKAAEYLGPDANAQQLIYVANQIRAFASSAADFLLRGDYGALNRAITAFWNGVRDADKLAPPKQPLVPAGDTVFYNAGWSSEEEYGLRNMLLKGLGGVTIGDRCTAIDAEGATLASGKRVSKKAALEAYVPQAGGKLTSVGSLPVVMNTILRARS